MTTPHRTCRPTSRRSLEQPASRVLASVQYRAGEGILLARFHYITVNPTAAASKVIVHYSGTPEFKPINGTSMFYATNTADRVIKASGSYFLCQQGIWFTSPDAQGPWTTAEAVPKEIYSIPPSSPVYNVTYVTQSLTSDGNITASHTAGYFGSFVVGAAVGAILCSGSGYYYPPFFYYPAFGYPYYRPYVATYGMGAFYSTYAGAYGVARGVYGPYGGAGGWASYNPYTGAYSRGVTAYGPYGSGTADLITRTPNLCSRRHGIERLWNQNECRGLRLQRSRRSNEAGLESIRSVGQFYGRSWKSVCSDCACDYSKWNGCRSANVGR
jgi:hypothetical protein